MLVRKISMSQYNFEQKNGWGCLAKRDNMYSLHNFFLMGQGFARGRPKSVFVLMTIKCATFLQNNSPATPSSGNAVATITISKK